MSGEFGENPKLSCNRNGSFFIASLSQRDEKMKNEVGVPLSICKICEVWIGFFPIKIYSGNFSTDLDFFMTVAILHIP